MWEAHLTRKRLADILGCNNQGLVVDLKKGFVTPNKRWDLSHGMSRYGLDYQDFWSSRKETMVINIFDTRLCINIYMMTQNVMQNK